MEDRLLRGPDRNSSNRMDRVRIGVGILVRVVVPAGLARSVLRTSTLRCFQQRCGPHERGPPHVLWRHTCHIAARYKNTHCDASESRLLCVNETQKMVIISSCSMCASPQYVVKQLCKSARTGVNQTNASHVLPSPRTALSVRKCFEQQYASQCGHRRALRHEIPETPIDTNIRSFSLPTLHDPTRIHRLSSWSRPEDGHWPKELRHRV